MIAKTLTLMAMLFASSPDKPPTRLLPQGCSGVGIIYLGDLNKPIPPVVVGTSHECTRFITTHFELASDRMWASPRIASKATVAAFMLEANKISRDETPPQRSIHRSDRKILSVAIIDHGNEKHMEFDTADGVALINNLIASTSSDKDVSEDLRYFSRRMNALISE